MATHSSVLAWRIPGTGEPGGLPSMGSHRVGHDWCDLAAAAAVHMNEYLISHINCAYWSYSLISPVAQLCPTLFDSMDCSAPGFPVHHQLPKLAQTPVHRVSDAIQPFHPLLSPTSDFSLSQHLVFCNESVLCIRWPKYWSFSSLISTD